MAYLPTFDYDLFISYSHVDNRPLTPGQRGWIDAFHETLEARLAMVLGEDPAVWRDPMLGGNEHFDDSLPGRVRGTAVFVSIVSPRYIHSEWCLRELQVFCDSAEASGGLRVGDRSRIFKVVKLPVDGRDTVPALSGTVGYDFYEVDRKGIPHELDPDMGEEARRGFRIKVDDIAYHIREILKEFRGERSVVRPVERATRTIYLAETTWELREERETVRRELRQRGFRVLPESPLPHTPEFHEAVREQLRQAELSVHLVGSRYGVVPEEEKSSVVAIQFALAAERVGRPGFKRIAWIAEGASPEDERQAAFLAALRTEAGAPEATEILEGAGIEDLKTTIRDTLERPAPHPAPPATTTGPQRDPAVYVICDTVDLDACLPVRDHLLAQGFEAILPLMEGDESEVREDHQANLVSCDAALVFWGRAGEAWVRAQLRELLKAPGYGRAAPIALQALFVAAPGGPAKERFRTRQAVTIREQGAFSASLRPFLEQLQPTS